LKIYFHMSNLVKISKYFESFNAVQIVISRQI